MKKDYEVYRDTGILGSYHPEMAVLREQSDGEVIHTEIPHILQHFQGCGFSRP